MRENRIARAIMAHISSEVEVGQWARLTQAEISSKVHTRRQTVAKYLRELEAAGYIELSANRRFLKVNDSMGLQAKCSKCSKCSIEIIRNHNEGLDGKCSKCSQGNVRNVRKPTILSFPLLRKEKVSTPGASASAHPRTSSSVPELPSGKDEILTYFSSLFPATGICAPPGIDQALRRAVDSYGLEVVKLALDDLSVKHKRRRLPAPSLILSFCDTIARSRQKREAQSLRPYDRPPEINAPISDAERKAGLEVFRRAREGGK